MSQNQFPEDVIKNLSPLNLVDDNQEAKLPNLVAVFEKDLMYKYGVLEREIGHNNIMMEHIYNLVVNYTLQLLITLHHQNGFKLPKSLVKQTKEQMLDASYNCFEMFVIPDIKEQYTRDIEDMLLDKNIVIKNRQYMLQFE